MMSRSLELFAFRGIRIEVHYSWLLLGFLVSSSLATGWFPEEVPNQTPLLYWVFSVGCALALLFSIALHELAHALVGRHFQMSIDRITLFLFGGVAQLEDEPKTPKAEFLMALAGPALSLVLAALFWLAYLNVGAGPTLMSVSMSYLTSMNLIIAVFNLLPGFPMDGGRVIRALLWYFRGDYLWATKTATGIGQICGFGLAALGLYSVSHGHFVSGIWGVLLGSMLVIFARASYRQALAKKDLEGKPITFFIDRHPATVTLGTPLAVAAHELVLHRTQETLPVIDQNEKLLGCVKAQSLGRFPPRDWPAHRVSEIIEKCPPDQKIDLGWDAQEALKRMTKQNEAHLFVMNGNRLLGLLTRASLLRYLQIRRTSTGPLSQ